jgi:hypothetical protein
MSADMRLEPHEPLRTGGQRAASDGGQRLKQRLSPAGRVQTAEGSTACATWTPEANQRPTRR